jgi:hypothetical protein
MKIRDPVYQAQVLIHHGEQGQVRLEAHVQDQDPHPDLSAPDRPDAAPDGSSEPPLQLREERLGSPLLVVLLNAFWSWRYMKCMLAVASEEVEQELAAMAG